MAAQNGFGLYAVVCVCVCVLPWPAKLHSVKIDLYSVLTGRYIPFIDFRQVDQLGANFEAAHTADVALECWCIHIWSQQICRIVATDMELEVLRRRCGRSMGRQHLCK